MAKVTIDRRDWDDDDLPDVCICCGEPAEERVRKSFSWMPGWIYFLLLIHFLIFLIVALLNRETWRGSMPVCRRCRGHWSRRTALMYLSLAAVPVLAFLLGVVVGVFNPSREDAGFVVGFGMFVIGLLLWIVLVVVVNQKTILAAKMTRRAIMLTGVSPGFKDAYAAQVNRQLPIEERHLERWSERQRKHPDDRRVRREQDEEEQPRDDRIQRE